MKKVLLIIVIFISLLGCAYETTTPIELISAKIITVGNSEVAMFEIKNANQDQTLTDQNQIFVLIEFDPPDTLKKFIETLPAGQKMHLKYHTYENSNFIFGLEHDPSYHVIEQIVLIPSGRKYNF